MFLIFRYKNIWSKSLQLCFRLVQGIQKLYLFTIESPDIMDATVIIVFGCSDNFRLFYCVFAIKKTCIFVSDGAILCFYMYPY